MLTAGAIYRNLGSLERNDERVPDTSEEPFTYTKHDLTRKMNYSIQALPGEKRYFIGILGLEVPHWSRRGNI